MKHLLVGTLTIFTFVGYLVSRRYSGRNYTADEEILGKGFVY